MVKNHVVEVSYRSNIAGNITSSKSQPKNTVLCKNKKYQRQVRENSLMVIFHQRAHTTTGQGLCAVDQETYLLET